MSQDYQITNNHTLFTIHNESGFDVPMSQPNVEELGELVSSNESCSFGLIEVIYVNESAILETNRNYLNHDYVTDIITFPYQDSPLSRVILMPGFWTVPYFVVHKELPNRLRN